MAAENENTKRSPNRRRRTWILVLLVLLVVVQLLCDPLSVFVVTAQQVVLRIQLAQARLRWDSAAIADYDLTVSGYTPLTCIVQEQTIRVRGGVPETAAAGYGEWCQVPRSVSQSFDVLERSLDWGTQVQAGFDRQYGYVSDFHFDCNYGHGLLSPVVTDCSGGFTINQFTPRTSP
jgi:hypothetical protein